MFISAYMIIALALPGSKDKYEVYEDKKTYSTLVDCRADKSAFDSKYTKAMYDAGKRMKGTILSECQQREEQLAPVQIEPLLIDSGPLRNR